METWLSILITYFDEAELLRECLESLGTLPLGVEVLVHDDCSPTRPASQFVVEGVQVVRSEHNVGPGAGRNRLLSLARGRYVHFHDADDLFLSNFFAQLQSALANGEADLLISDTRIQKGGHRELRALRWPSGLALLPYLLLPERALLVPCVTWQRTALLKLGGFDSRYQQSEDFELFLRAALAGVSIVRLELDLVEVRVRSTSRSLRVAEVYRDALSALAAHEAPLKAQAPFAASDKVAHVGALLYRMGEQSLAKEAFALCRRLGRPQLATQSRPYRACALLFGLWAAEAVRAFQHRFRTNS